MRDDQNNTSYFGILYILLTLHRQKTCSVWQNCPQDLCFQGVLPSHWNEENHSNWKQWSKEIFHTGNRNFFTWNWDITHIGNGKQFTLKIVKLWIARPLDILPLTCHMLRDHQDSPELPSGKTFCLTNSKSYISFTCTFGQQPLQRPNMPPWATIFLR